MSGKLVVPTLFMIAAFYGPIASAAPPDDYINEGKPYMLGGTLSGLRQAYAIFDKGMDDPEANTDRRLIFLHAVTRTVMLFIDNQDLAVQNSFLELAQAFGVTVTGDLLDELVIDLTVDPDGYYRVPDSAPSPEEIAEIINTSIIPEIVAIVAELDSISDTPGDRFRMFFTPDETGLENDLEVDYGEVLVLKGLLQACKGLLQVQTAYDIFINVDESLLQHFLYEDGINLNDDEDEEDEGEDTQLLLDLLRIIYIYVDDPGQVSINKHFLQRYPNLLKLLPTPGHPEDGTAILTNARKDLLDGIEYYLAALEYIRSEDDPPGTDPQEDELLYLDPEAAFLVDNVDEKLIALRDSLLKGTIITCPIETLRAYSVSGTDLSGALILEPDYGGLAPFYEGEEGSLTFLTGIPPSPWDVEWFAIGPEQIEVEVKRGEWPNRTWGYFEAVLSEDAESFSDGTFDWWGHEEGSVSGLSGALDSTEVMDVNINLNPIFGSSPPVSPRDLLPQFDNENTPIPGTFGHGLGNDATLGGILPDMTQSDWAALLGLSTPDLVGEVVSTTLPSPATTGDKGKVRVNVENQGDATATGKIRIDVYASTDETLDGGDKLLGSASNQSIALKPGSTKAFDVSVEIPSDLVPDRYYFLAYIDSTNTITEINEDNNLAVSASTFGVKWPDLVGTITHTFKEPAAAGDAAKVVVVVKNQGNVLAKGKINVPIYLSTDQVLDGGDRLLTTAINRPINLKPDKFVTLHISTTLPADLLPGDYYFLADIDSTDTIRESDEDNNLAVTADTLTVERPDLVGAITHTFKEPAAPADAAKARVVVTNQGNVLAKGKINVAIYLSTDALLDGGDALLTTALNRPINLKPGKFVTLQISTKLPVDLTPGDHYLLAQVDSTNTIAESNEDNNLAATADTLTAERPDLVGTITHTFKEPAAPGAKASVKVVVTNQGNVLAKGKINIDVYASTDQALDGGDRLVATSVNRSINLKAGKSVTFSISVTLPADLTPGDYYFLADVDSTDTVAESNEANNVAATADSLTVQ